MMRRVEMRKGRFKTKVGILDRRVINKDTRRGTGGKFARRVRLKPWITKSSKTTKFRVVWRSVIKFNIPEKEISVKMGRWLMR